MNANLLAFKIKWINTLLPLLLLLSTHKQNEQWPEKKVRFLFSFYLLFYWTFPLICVYSLCIEGKLNYGALLAYIKSSSRKLLIAAMCAHSRMYLCGYSHILIKWLTSNFSNNFSLWYVWKANTEFLFWFRAYFHHIKSICLSLPRCLCHSHTPWLSFVLSLFFGFYVPFFSSFNWIVGWFKLCILLNRLSGNAI